MNTDHAVALRDYCRQTLHQHAAAVLMIGIDCDGFDVIADGEPRRFEFAEPVVDATTARAALVAMARQARA